VKGVGVLGARRELARDEQDPAVAVEKARVRADRRVEPLRCRVRAPDLIRADGDCG